jgi:hypothetical protein
MRAGVVRLGDHVGRNVRRSTRLVLAVGLLAALSLGLPALAAGSSADLPPGSPNTISGAVHDTHGDPVGCIVGVSHWDSDSEGWHEAAMGFSSPTDGSYLITGLPADTYRVEFLDFQGAWGFFYFAFNHRPQVYASHDLTYMEWWNLGMGETPTFTPDYVVVPPNGPGPTAINGLLSLEPASISGHVRDESGNPIAGVSATLYGVDMGSQLRALCSVPVGVDGAYAFRGLVPDGVSQAVDESSAAAYRVGFSDETSGAWNAQYYRDTQSFASAASLVCTGTELTGVDATLTPASVCVTGTVTDANTRLPLGGIVVGADSEDKTNADYPPVQVNARTMDDGTYELRGLIPGREYWVGPDPTEWDYATQGRSHFTYSGQPVGGLDFALYRAMRTDVFGYSGEETQVDVRGHQYEDGYEGLADAVVTPAETRYLADAVSAPGLCWAYQVTTPGSVNLGKNAPLFALRRSGASIGAKQEIADIGLHNGTPDHHLTLRVVGTPTSVPQSVLAGIRDYAASVGVTVTIDRLVSRANSTRYDVAAAVAKRMKARADASPTDAVSMPGFAFIANGDQSARIMGPLTCSAVSAARGAPVLPVTMKGRVPKPITRALKSLRMSPRRLYIPGSSNSVSEKVRKALKIPKNNRIQGPRRGADRYTVAVAVANKALSMKWLRGMHDVAVAATPYDALVGGTAVGDAGGELLLEDTSSGEAQPATLGWVRAHKSRIDDLWFVGYSAAVHQYDDGYEQLGHVGSPRRTITSVRGGLPVSSAADALTRFLNNPDRLNLQPSRAHRQ